MPSVSYNITKPAAGSTVAVSTYNNIVSAINSERVRRGQSSTTLPVLSQSTLVTAGHLNAALSHVNQWNSTSHSVTAGTLITPQATTWLIDGLNQAGSDPLYTPFSWSGTVSGQGVTDVPTTLPAAESVSMLIRHYGGWGQSGETGEVSALNSVGGFVVRFRENNVATVPAGKVLYRVSNAGVFTATPTFPHQNSAKHYNYFEIHSTQGIATVRSDGAPGNVSNPTSFVNMAINTFDPNSSYDTERAAILATLTTADYYWVVR